MMRMSPQFFCKQCVHHLVDHETYTNVRTDLSTRAHIHTDTKLVPFNDICLSFWSEQVICLHISIRKETENGHLSLGKHQCQR